MKKLFLSLLCAVCAVVVNAQTITIQGVLVTRPEPCVGEYCTTCLSLAIATTDKTYFINGKCGLDCIATTVDGVTSVFCAGDEVIATGTVTTGVDNDGDEFYRIEVTAISKREEVDWCTQWNVLEYYNTTRGDSKGKTYVYIAYGDTTIADKTYKQILGYYSLAPSKLEYVAAIRQQGDSLMVYYENAEYLLCDFGVQVGDEREVFMGINNWELYGYNNTTGTYRNKVTDVSVLSDGRRKISVDIYFGEDDEYYGNAYYNGWIEGVGSTGGLLHTGADGGRVGGSSYTLLCASSKGNCVFSNNSGWLADFDCVENFDIDVDRDIVPSTTHEGHAYVDLGLPSGTLWATNNVGAANPEEYGDYFAWGEIATKEFYDFSTYEHVIDGDISKHTKYCSDPAYGTVDNKTQLDLEDDVAHVLWGGDWRMPTKKEFDELGKQCTWTWKESVGTIGMSGFEVVSKTNGNSIFLPACGWITDSSLKISMPNELGCYWSSSRDANYPTVAWYLMFAADGQGTGVDGRSQGQSVRPVMGKTANALPTVGTGTSSTIRKVIENGQLVIIRDGVRYNVLGVRL